MNKRFVAATKRLSAKWNNPKTVIESCRIRDEIHLTTSFIFKGLFKNEMIVKIMFI